MRLFSVKGDVAERVKPLVESYQAALQHAI